MAEPDNHTLRLLREIRGAVQSLDQKVDRQFSDLTERVDTLTRAVAGELVQARYVTAGVDERLADTR
jgi:phage terminase Nu1 subunit (DNA packaging protein)